MSDHERIWLQASEDAKHQAEGRLWCQDKVWPDDPEDGDPTEYVRADLYAALEAENARLAERVHYAEGTADANIKRADEVEADREALRVALAEAMERSACFRQILVETLDSSPAAEGAQEFVLRLSEAMEVAADKFDAARALSKQVGGR